jgi:glycosyltransferase involved in cell wall biosynthesis
VIELVNPFISFIIPTLNEEKWIENPLKFIKNQRYKNYEIIIVDSYSQDKTVEIAKKYTNKIVTCKKEGPGFARNIGAKKAKGEILVFLDADTILESNFLDKVVNQFSEDSVVLCTPELKPDKGNVIHFIWFKIFYLVQKFFLLFNIPIIWGTCFVCKKEFFYKAGKFNPDLKKGGEDLDLAYRISKKGKTVILNSRCITSQRREEKIGLIKWMILYALAVYNFILFKDAKFKNYEFGNF